MRVVLASLALALGVQLVAFSVAWALRKHHMWLGWGLGSGLRLIALVLYGVVVARLWPASLTPALLSFVAVLFVTTIVEPLLLKR